jgi:hypothetical protein
MFQQQQVLLMSQLGEAKMPMVPPMFPSMGDPNMMMGASPMMGAPYMGMPPMFPGASDSQNKP